MESQGLSVNHSATNWPESGIPLNYTLQKNLIALLEEREIAPRSSTAFSSIKKILCKTDVSPQLIEAAATLSEPNPYHNFTHELAVTDEAISLASLGWHSKTEINAIAIASLFHDALHTWTPLPKDEEMAFSALMNTGLYKEHIGRLWVDVYMLRELILSTKFIDHWKVTNPLQQILQDADLDNISKWVWHMLYASLPLCDEMWWTPWEFKKNQIWFIEYLAKDNPEVFVAQVTKDHRTNPILCIEELQNLDQSVIDEAYTLRFSNLTEEEFLLHIGM